MKKFNRREKTILRLLVAVIGLAILAEGWERYKMAKLNLEDEVDGKRSQITTFMKKLEGESAEKYKSLANELDDELGDAHNRVLILPQETDANLFMSQTISEVAEAAGLTINSISNRKSEKISEESELREVRTYFGYDADLPSLLRFFEAISGQPEFFISIENLNVSARRQPKRRNKKNNRRNRRRPLNGNAILTTVFKADPQASLDRYEKARAAAVEAARPPEGEEDEELEGSSLGDAIEAANEAADGGDPPVEKPRFGRPPRVPVNPNDDEGEPEDEDLVDEGVEDVDEAEEAEEEVMDNKPITRPEPKQFRPSESDGRQIRPGGLKPAGIQPSSPPKRPIIAPTESQEDKGQLKPPKLDPKPKPLSHTARVRDARSNIR